MKHFASSHNQKKDNNQSKNNKHSEVPENQTAWNSDNQGVKETFTQTGSRAGGVETGSWAKRTCSKVADQVGKAGLAGWETKTQS